MFGSPSNNKFKSAKQSLFPPECCTSKDGVEQGRLVSSTMTNESDLSLYGSTSPKKLEPPNCSDNCSSKMESHTSRDSGYSSNWGKSASKSSSSSMDFMDDEFLELENLVVDDNTQLPKEFETLIHGSIPSPQPYQLKFKPILKRSISFNEDVPSTSKAVYPPKFPIDTVRISPLKRSVQSNDDWKSPVSNKRLRVHETVAVDSPTKSVFQRSISATEESIMFALQRAYAEPDLIGDFTSRYCLPLIAGRHPDLKSISPTTLAMLVKGEFNEVVSGYKVIDCRYPYEYSGGHIMGAINIYNKQQIVEELLNIYVNPPIGIGSSQKRDILIFHCEFSSERGPNLCRYLRNIDRIINKNIYPALYYPELYILDGGYKNFFGEYADFCDPAAYKPMLHPEHHDDLNLFKAKTKSADRLVNDKFSARR